MSKFKPLLDTFDKYMFASPTMQAMAARQVQDAQDMLAQQNYAMAQAAQAQNWPPPIPPDGPPPQENTRDAMQTRAKELFINRLKGVRGTGFRKEERDFVATHVLDDKVYLFYMLRGKEGVVSEGVDIFPSDTLIAQFRLILS